MNAILSVTRCLGPVWKTALSLVIIDTLQIIDYVTNPIQFQGGNENFLYLFYEKIFIFILCSISIGRCRLYLADTDTTRYHKNRLIPPIPILKYRYITIPYFILYRAPAAKCQAGYL